LRSLPNGLSDELLRSAGKSLLEAAESGKVELRSSADWLLLLKLMEGAAPSDFALRQITSLSGHGDPKVREAALTLARDLGPMSAKLVPILWQRLLDPKHPTERRLEIINTLTAIEQQPSIENWKRLLLDADVTVRTDAVRSWRAHAKNPKLVEILASERPKLTLDVPALADDLDMVLEQLRSNTGTSPAKPTSDADKQKLTEATLNALEKLPPERRKVAHLLGRRVFERSSCVKCHTTVSENTPRAPSLQGIGRTQKPDYLVESVLHPSKVIKTGFETEVITTVDGKALTGLVREEGDQLRIFEADRETLLPRGKIEQRTVSKLSIMPQGQEQQLSRNEFVDLMAYLISLR
jgi:putative heme-binding domain-containing protein